MEGQISKLLLHKISSIVYYIQKNFEAAPGFKRRKNFPCFSLPCNAEEITYKDVQKNKKAISNNAFHHSMYTSHAN